MEAFSDFAKAGRRPTPMKVSGKKNVVTFPGEAWTFSSHALIRLGERHLDPSAAAAVAENPATVYPGLNPGTEVRVGGGIKVVILPAKRLILTVASRNEEVENVA